MRLSWCVCVLVWWNVLPSLFDIRVCLILFSGTGDGVDTDRDDLGTCSFFDFLLFGTFQPHYHHHHIHRLPRACLAERSFLFGEMAHVR
jgi:hypothetical protein